MMQILLRLQKAVKSVCLAFACVVGVASTASAQFTLEFGIDDFTLDPQFNTLSTFNFSIGVDELLVAGGIYNNSALSVIEYNIFGVLDDPTPSGFPSFDLQRTIIGDEFYTQGSSLSFTVLASADLSDGLQVSELAVGGNGSILTFNGREVDTGRYHPALFELFSDNTGSIQNSNNNGGVNPGSGMVVDVDFGDEYIVDLGFSPVLTLATSPASGQGIDLGNVIDGDVIDNSTPIPDGAVINLNGGSIAVGTTFSAAEFPNGVELNINDGVVGLDFEINNSTINIAGGEVALGAIDLAEGVNNFSNTVTVTGGDVGGFFQLRGNSTLEILGGNVESFGTLTNASATVNGGAFTFMDNNGELNLISGDVGTFRALPNSVVNIFGTDFAIDGVPITGLTLNTPSVVFERDMTLSGTLSDGSTFSNFLDSMTPISELDFGPFDDLEDLESVPGFASTTATINVILVPAIGDFDADGDVDGDDVDFYIGNLNQPATGNFAQLDLDGDGEVTLADHNFFVTTLVVTSNGVTGALLGDINLDGTVDILSDAFALVAGLGQSVTSRSQGDLNADAVVDVLNDAFILIGDLGQSNAP
ncbi:hypothetical protein N9L06_04885 [Mariniblastus sp.]|nr:hypothetical protein [Mariniblastus sp.]